MAINVHDHLIAPQLKARDSEDMTKPLYIAFEGIDGVGQSSQIRLLEDYLGTHSSRVAVYRHTKKGNNLVGWLIEHLYFKMPKGLIRLIRNSELLRAVLFAWNAHLNDSEINDITVNCDILISDRSILTAFVVHTHVLGNQCLSYKFISLIQPKVVPNLVILLDVDPTIGIQWISNRSAKSLDENISSATLYRQRYLQMAYGKDPKFSRDIEWRIVDASQHFDEVRRQILTEISSTLKLDCNH